ncbi:MAG: hypothetical protein K2Y31_13975 [Burkholderiales bacterium]|jgi:hypothetical protein|nr:hypothetical protein [Burkholderiales bacterium]
MSTHKWFGHEVGEIIVCSGDIQNGPWEYGMENHQLVTMGYLGTKTLKLKKELQSITPLSGPEFEAYKVNNKGLFGAGQRAMGQIAGGWLGGLIASKSTEKNNESIKTDDLVCFEAILRSGKKFVGLTSQKVLQRIQDHHRQNG